MHNPVKEPSTAFSASDPAEDPRQDRPEEPRQEPRQDPHQDRRQDRRVHRSHDFRHVVETLNSLVRAVEHGQNVQLDATSLLREEIAALQGLLAHLIQIITPEQSEDEGPGLRELLAHIIQHQREMTRLQKETIAASGRIEAHLCNRSETLSSAKAS